MPEEYKIYEHPDMGYALFKRTGSLMQQVSRWYWRLGNLYRHNDNARLANIYKW